MEADNSKQGGKSCENRAKKAGKPQSRGKAKSLPQNVSISDYEALRALSASAETAEPEPYYEVIKSGARAGVWFVNVKHDKDGAASYAAPLKLSDPFEVIGRGQTIDEQEQRVLQYRRNMQGEIKTAAFPLAMAGMRDGLAYLRALGIGVAQNGQAQARLAEFLQWEGDKTEWQIAARGGWLDGGFNAYALPSGEIVGKPENKAIYTGDASKKAAYAKPCTLEEWQNQVARWCVGNSRLLLALGAVFAAPLLSLMQRDSGGFHIYGGSSVGKSICAKTALSVIGNPVTLIVQWKGTSLGFDNEAAANNDCFLVLDEMGQADKPQAVADTSYSLFNGVSKVQGAAKGGNRARNTWRVLALSTGEYSAASHMEHYGIAWNAGQAVRLPSVAADAGKGYGLFDTLHGFESSRAFAENLERAAKTSYGAAWRAYLAGLAAMEAGELMRRVHALEAEFSKRLPQNLTGQPARVSKRFILAAAALELAGEMGVTGFERGAGFDGLQTAFNAWYEADGQGNREEMQILERARDFLQTRGMSGDWFVQARNIPLNDGTGSFGSYETGRNHAGFVVPAGFHNTSSEPLFYLTEAAFKQYICAGFDVRAVASVLKSRQWLQAEKGRNQMKLPAIIANATHNTNARFYCLRGDVIPPAA